MTLLVAGADRVDAGKTTFTAGLVEYTGAVGFKPRAGNDCWFDTDDVRRAVGDGRLYGKDAKRLAAASPGTLTPEELNPVHRLWRPAPGPESGLLGQEDREFLLDRAGDRYVVNATVDLPERIRRALPVEEAVSVDSLAELNRAMERYHLPALERLGETVAATDRAVVESYSDVARPLQTVEPEAVAVVEPRRVRLYDGGRFDRACEVATRSPQAGTLEERVGAVLDLVDPVATVDLPALPAESRGEPAAVADAYAPAYRALLDV